MKRRNFFERVLGIGVAVNLETSKKIPTESLEKTLPPTIKVNPIDLSAMLNSPPSYASYPPYYPVPCSYAAYTYSPNKGTLRILE